jgi:uncharacterized protein YpuA (DUF1002 family)
MAQVLELLDRLEEILKQTLPEDKAKEAKRLITEISQEVAKETLEKEIPNIEETLSKRLASKEDLYKVKEELKEEIYKLREELSNYQQRTEQKFSQVEKELLALKILLWVVVILSGLSAFPQLLNLLKIVK